MNYGYDQAGNVVSYAGRVLEYDGLGRMVRVLQSGSEVARYTYNLQNQRVKKLSGGVSTIYHYDVSGKLVAESQGEVTVREYAYLGTELSALPIALISSGSRYYYHVDHLGMPVRMTDGVGQVAWEAGYTAFGLTSVSAPLVVSHLRLPGQYFDAETALHYNWHRYYAPELGRYLQPDPLGLAGGSTNLYAYVSNNPLGWIDPTGLINLRIPGTTGETTVHANPGPEAVPQGSRIPVEHGPAHVHMGGNSGPRVRLDDFEPFSEKDARMMSRRQRNFCKALSEEDKARIRARQAEVFKKGFFTGAVGLFADTVTQHCTNDPLDCYELFNEPED